VISLHDVPADSKDAFRAKLRRLAAESHVVSLSSAYERSHLDDGRLNVALTFDDGYKEHATYVPELLEELGLPATFFVPSGSLDLAPGQAGRFARDRLRRRSSLQFMTSADLTELARRPLFEIGGHTRTHADLGQLMDQAELDDEIAGDKAALEHLIGHPLRWFAFPFGVASNVTLHALRAIEEAGYRASFTIMPSFWTRTRSPFLVGRDSLSPASSDRLWGGFLSGGYDPITWLKYGRAVRRLGAARGGAD
jgi:peptidoglycan/xylan/chitin deacetylase (PgdA/CDA1 family)